MDMSGNVRNHFKNHLWTFYHPDTRTTFKEKTFTLNEIVSFKVNDEFFENNLSPSQDKSVIFTMNYELTPCDAGNSI